MFKQALLVMDVQNGIVERFAPQPEVMDPFRRAVEAARGHGVAVLFVRVAFREGCPEVSPRNKSFSALLRGDGPVLVGTAADIHPSVAPRPLEPVVTKLRVSAFAGSDLEVILRSQEIDTLVLCGIATSGVVLSTVREAADRDYRLIVLSDACLDADPQVHRVLMEKVFPRQAQVMSVDEWAASLIHGGPA